MVDISIVGSFFGCINSLYRAILQATKGLKLWVNSSDLTGRLLHQALCVEKYRGGFRLTANMNLVLLKVMSKKNGLTEGPFGYFFF